MYPCTIMHAPIFFQILNNKLHGQQHPWHNINNTLNTTPTNDKNADHTINIWGREQSFSFFLFVIPLKKEKKGSKFVKENMKYFKIFYFWNKIK
jgi:phosphorylcholine metabolism protein LicD